MAAHNWRSLRQRVGGDLMALASMHAVLDHMESFGAEAAVSGSTKQGEAETKLSKFYDRLYKPDLSEQIRRVNGDEELLKPPPGFEDDEVEASFDAFLSAANSR